MGELELSWVWWLFVVVLLLDIVTNILRIREEIRSRRHHEARTVDPDLAQTAIRVSLHEATEQVAVAGQELACAWIYEGSTISWALQASDARAELSRFYNIKPEFLPALVRLTIAVRASNGEALSDHELGVLHGVLPARRGEEMAHAS